MGEESRLLPLPAVTGPRLSDVIQLMESKKALMEDITALMKRNAVMSVAEPLVEREFSIIYTPPS